MFPHNNTCERNLQSKIGKCISKKVILECNPMREQSGKIKKDSLYDYECETAGMNSVMINITEDHFCKWGI